MSSQLAGGGTEVLRRRRPRRRFPEVGRHWCGAASRPGDALRTTRRSVEGARGGDRRRGRGEQAEAARRLCEASARGTAAKETDKVDDSGRGGFWKATRGGAAAVGSVEQACRASDGCSTDRTARKGEP